MRISTRRIRLFVTSLTLAALALGAVGIVLFQVGVRGVAAAPALVRPDGPARGDSKGKRTELVGSSGQRRLRLDAQVDTEAVPADGSEEISVQQAGPELTISKSDDIARVAPGDILTYTITITNTGPQSASGVVVTDTLPVSTTFVGPSGWGQVGSTRKYTYTFAGTLGKNDPPWTVTLTVALTDALPVSVAFITNTVEVADDDAAYAADTDVDAVVPQQELAVSKTDGVTSVEPGEILTYTITITNSGYLSTTNVVVTDTLPESTTYQTGTNGWQPVGSTGAYTLSLGTLTEGATQTLTLTVALTDPVPAGLEVITNTVEVSGGGDESAAYAWDMDNDTVNAAPILAIRKTDAVTQVVPGQRLTYTIAIANTGDQDASGVVVTDTLPESTEFGGPSGWHRVASTMDYTYTVGLLTAGYTETLTLTVTVTDVVPADLDVITNTVEVADDGEARDDDTDEDAVDAAPDLMISKTNADDSVQPGDVITYTVTITNTGDRDATGVVVTDTLPQLTSFGGGTSDWEPVTGSPGRYIYTIGTLAGTDARVLTLTVALTDAVPVDLDYITNTVEVADDGEAQDDDTDEDAVDAAPELEISKTDALTTVVPGQTMTYTITITNTGDRDTTGVVVTDTLPESTTYHTGTAAWQPMASTNAYTYTIGDLGAGRTRTLTLTVRLTDTVPTGLEEITNTVEVSDDGLNGSPAAGEATDVNAVDAAPDLVISKTDGVTSVVPSQTVTYTLTITNVGTQDATGVAVTDTLPAGDYSDFVAASDLGIPWNGRILWLPFDLPAGDSVIRTVTLAVKDLDPWPVGVEVITNTAEVSDDGSNGADLNPEDNKGIDADGIDASPDLLIAKDDGEESAAPGDLLVYELSYLNKGSQNATGVVITETVPEHTTFNAGASTSGWQMVDASGVYTFSLGLVPVGSGGAVDFAVTVSDTLPAGVEIITNTAQIADDGSSGLDEMPADNSDADETILIAAPDLSVAKDDGLDSVEPGQVVTYTLTIENVGTQGATGVVVSDTLPGPTELITASHGGVESDGVVVWTGMELTAGDSFTRSLTVQVLPSIPARVDFITNTVSVADDGANGEDLTVEDNAAEDVDAVEAVPVLALLKMDGRASVKPGEVLTYTLLAKNVGEQAASDLVMSDTLPAHTTYITASQGGVESNGVVVWAGLEVDVGAQLERTVTVQVNQVIPPGVSTITNQAEIAGPEGVYDSAQDVDTLVPVPNLILTKEDGEDRVSAEQVVTYTLTIANGGTGEATGVLLSDTLPTATVFVAASDGGDETGPSSGVVTWPTFDLAAGASLTRTVTVQVLDAIPAGVEAITNTASVADDGTHGPDADLSNNSAEDVDLVDADPVLSIAKSDGRNTVGPGEVLAYTVTISNTGTQDVMGVVVTDTLPAHTEFVSASADYTFNLVDGVVVWEAFALGVDEVVIRTVTVQLDEALPDGVDAITNTVLAVEDGGLSAAADDVDTVISAPDLRVVKTDGRLGAQPGETLTYTLMVENVGTQAATGVVLSDTLPANTSFAGASDAGSEDGGVVTWPEFVLDAGTMVTRTVTVQMIGEWPTGATPILINTASVADDGANGADPVTENNTDIDITHVWLHHFYFPLISRH